MLKYLKNKKLNIGILGGSFDPPHFGHTKISEIAIKKFKLDYMIWVITKKNPLKKQPYLKLKERINLSKKILKNKKKIKVEYLEHLTRSNNTFSLIKYLKNKNLNAKIYFLMGADNFVFFHKWHRWKKIAKIAKILVFDRQKFKIKALNSIASKKLNKSDWIFINFKKVNISSSKIKKNW